MWQSTDEEKSVTYVPGIKCNPCTRIIPSAKNLTKLITDAAVKGIRERFTKAKEAKRHADHNVEAGREFVEAYVLFTHYVERLHLDSTAEAEHHHGAPKAATEEHHKH